MKRIISLITTLALLPFLTGAVFPFSFWKGAGGGPTYLLQEDFTTGSGTTPPTGWATVTGGTWNFSNPSPALPQGGNNASVHSLAADSTWDSFSSQTECWGYFQFNYASALSAQKLVFALRDSSGVNVCFVKVDNTGSVSIWDNNAEATGTVGTMSVNTNYHVWMHYKAGAGTGVIDVAFSTTGTRPTSGSNFAQVTSTTTNTAVARVALIVNDDGVTQYFDHVIVNNSQIGDNP